MNLLNVLLSTGGIIAIAVISAVVFILLIVLICHIRIIKQTEKVIVERLGAYHATWGVGIHFLVPFIDRVSTRVTMKEQVRDFEPQSVITKDNVTIAPFHQQSNLSQKSLEAEITRYLNYLEGPGNKKEGSGQS